MRFVNVLNNMKAIDTKNNFHQIKGIYVRYNRLLLVTAFAGLKTEHFAVKNIIYGVEYHLKTNELLAHVLRKLDRNPNKFQRFSISFPSPKLLTMKFYGCSIICLMTKVIHLKMAKFKETRTTPSESNNICSNHVKIGIIKFLSLSRLKYKLFCRLSITLQVF